MIKELTTKWRRIDPEMSNMLWYVNRSIYHHCKYTPHSSGLVAITRAGLLIGAFTIGDMVGHPEVRYLKWIEVEPSKRGKGYGTMLMAEAMKSNFDTIKVRKDNIPAKKLFEKFGFIVSEEDHEYEFMIKDKESEE